MPWKSGWGGWFVHGVHGVKESRSECVDGVVDWTGWKGQRRATSEETQPNKRRFLDGSHAACSHLVNMGGRRNTAKGEAAAESKA